MGANTYIGNGPNFMLRDDQRWQHGTTPLGNFFTRPFGREGSGVRGPQSGTAGS